MDPTAVAAIDKLTSLCPVDKYSTERVRELVALFYKDDPETVALVIRLLSSGTLAAQEEVRSHLNSVLTIIDQDDNDPDKGEEPEPFGEPLRHDIILSWHVANMATTTQADDDIDSLEDSATGWDYLLHKGEGGERSPDDDYWRGLSILGICATHSEYEADEEKASEFIRWAATRTDPERIITISKERDTIDVATLRNVIDQQDQITSGLRAGVL